MYIEIKEIDLDELVEVYIEAFNAEPWNDKWTKETASKRLRAMIKDSGFYGLKEIEEDKICGFILGHEEQFYDGIMFNIKEFCVGASLKGTGRGSKLLEVFEERLKSKGINEIILMTTKDDKAEGFYKRREYKSHNNLVLMGKEI